MPSSLFEYDAVRRRLWILGQRCHHGATGALVTSAALTALVTHALTPKGTVALAATGSLLMMHDRHDRSIWFRPGHQHQP